MNKSSAKTQSAMKIAIVVSRFNEMITKRLLNGCQKELARLGIKDGQLKVIWVPGSLELPVVALRLAKLKSIDAVICLGSVIRGETIHFELVSNNAASGIAQVALTTGKPVIFGVITTETVDQAYKRSNDKGDHKGVEAAQNAVEMVNILRSIK